MHKIIVETSRGFWHGYLGFHRVAQTSCLRWPQCPGHAACYRIKCVEIYFIGLSAFTLCLHMFVDTKKKFYVNRIFNIVILFVFWLNSYCRLFGVWTEFYLNLAYGITIYVILLLLISHIICQNSVSHIRRDKFVYP